MINAEKISVIGSGLMGHGIAQVFACQGFGVTIVDPNAEALQQAKPRVRANLSMMAEQGVSFADGVDDILERVEITTDMQAGCVGTAFVIEAVFENMALKQDVFAELDRICPTDVILCSNTSVMSITQIASKAQHRERIVGTHWWNPPYLIPLVEVVRTEQASDHAVEAAFELLTRAGKTPIRVNRDVPGFVGNRMQHALWREAFAIIDEGICDAATVDLAVRNSFGLRLSVLGPVENADMIGLDLTKAIHDYVVPHISAEATTSTIVQRLISEGQMGFKSGRGFLAWSDEDIAASRRRLLEYLVKVSVGPLPNPPP